jgi:hypothetical protein
MATTQWYSISFPAGITTGDGKFYGYFKVVSGVVEEFYRTINGSNVSVFRTDGNPFPDADNLYNPSTKFSWNGVNITITGSSYDADDSAYTIYSSVRKSGLYYAKDGETYESLLFSPTINTTNTTPTPPAAPPANPICFNEGTTILYLNKNLEEEYIPIENLRKGDLVKSFKHGYRRIALIGKNILVNNPDNFSQCMYTLKKTDDNGLTENLTVTGYHSILVDDLGDHKEENDRILGQQTIDGKHLLLAAVSKNFTKVENNNVFTYYHFILENNNDNEERFGVWANGILTETPSRNRFISRHLILL